LDTLGIFFEKNGKGAYLFDCFAISGGGGAPPRKLKGWNKLEQNVTLKKGLFREVRDYENVSGKVRFWPDYKSLSCRSRLTG
jgi:hypothetical protein